MRDDELENEGLIEQIHTEETQIIETILPTPLPPPVT